MATTRHLLVSSNLVTATFDAFAGGLIRETTVLTTLFRRHSFEPSRASLRTEANHQDAPGCSRLLAGCALTMQCCKRKTKIYSVSFAHSLNRTYSPIHRSSWWKCFHYFPLSFGRPSPLFGFLDIHIERCRRFCSALKEPCKAEWLGLAKC